MNTKMKALCVLAAIPVALLSAAPAARADDGRALVGAVLGAAAGVVVGGQLGGRDGAIIGGAIGGATGAAIGSQSRHYHGRVDYAVPVVYSEPAYAPPPQVVYAPPPQVVYAPPPQVVYAPPPQVVYAPPAPMYVPPQRVVYAPTPVYVAQPGYGPRGYYEHCDRDRGHRGWEHRHRHWD